MNQNKCLILIEITDDKFKLVNDFLVGNNFKIIFKSDFRLDYIYSNLWNYENFSCDRCKR